MEVQNRFIPYYLISGPVTEDFPVEHKDPDQIRYEQYLRSIVADRQKACPEGDIQIGVDSELGMPWEYYSPANGFINIPHTSAVPQKIEMLAATVLEAEEALEVPIILWTFTAVDLWVNGRKETVVNEPVYKPIRKHEAVLSLQQGANRIVLRLQNLGVRDTRNIAGIELLAHQDKLRCVLPDEEQGRPLIKLDEWLADIALQGEQLLLPPNPPGEVFLTYRQGVAKDSFAQAVEKGEALRITGEASVELAPEALEATVIATAHGAARFRLVELIHRNKPTYIDPSSPMGHVERMYRELASIGTDPVFKPERFGLFYVMARTCLGLSSDNDRAHLERALNQIYQRVDCSDFFLAGLLRYLRFYPLPEDLARRAEQVILEYRYWMTEDGADGMCFWSENHSLMFYINAYMAGKRYPDRVFLRSGLTGMEKSWIARAKIRQWLDDVEEWGFEEFLSADYMCVTLGALLNLIDFMEEPEASRAEALLDQMFREFAVHTFHGSIVAPQGRIYRSVILPFTQSAQSLIHLADAEAPYGNSEWLTFLMNSRYRLPKGLKELMRETGEREYQTGNAWVKVTREKDYMLTSVQSPRFDPNPRFWDNISFRDDTDMDVHEFVKSMNERYHGTTRFEPGVYGYQQHMWYAALDADTAVFANHPGELSDGGGMRPGYWYGNGIIPAIRQEGNALGAIFEIGGLHPVPFTHVFFPEDKMDEVLRQDGWLLGRKGDGLVAVWSSSPMVPWQDRLFNCEQRVYGDSMAYVCQCGSVKEYGSLEKFADFCRGLEPVFEEKTLTLSMAGGYRLNYVRMANRTQYV